MALMSAADVRTGYIRTLTGTAEDAKIVTLVSRFDGLAAEWCGLPYPDSTTLPTFEAAAYTLYPEPSLLDGRVLPLGFWPVVSVTSVHIDPDRDYGATDAVSASDYDTDKARGELILRPDATDAWSTALRANRVIISGGYSAVPGALAHACGMQVAHWFKHPEAISATSSSAHGKSIQLNPYELLPAVREALTPFQVAAIP